MAGGGKFFISTTVTGEKEAVAKYRNSGKYLSEGAKRASTRAEAYLNSLLGATFSAAIENSGEGFPAIYGIHLLSVLGTNLPRISANGTNFSVEYDFGKLGTMKDLQEGYHYGAQLASGGTVTLPYHSAALKNDVEIRYQFWLALNEKIHIENRPPPGNLINETFAARVAYWSSKGVAPQWLLLNYGQGNYYPFIRPFAIVENVRQAFYLGAKAIFAQETLAAASKIEVNTAAYQTHTAAEIGSRSEALAKFGKFPAHYQNLIAEVLSAKSVEEIQSALASLRTFEAVDAQSLKALLKPNTQPWSIQGPPGPGV